MDSNISSTTLPNLAVTDYTEQSRQLQQAYELELLPQQESVRIGYSSANCATQFDGAHKFVHSTLRETLEKYSDKPDLFQLVLEAKVAEERRVSEEERRVVEKLFFDSKVLELEIMKEQRKIATSFTIPVTASSEIASSNVYPLSDELHTNEILSRYSSSSSVSPLHSYALEVTSQFEMPSNQGSPQLPATTVDITAISNTTAFINGLTTINNNITNAHRANSQPLRTPRRFPSPSTKKGSSQVNLNSDSRIALTHPASKGVNKRGRSLSHAEVMEALRSKIRAKNRIDVTESALPSDNTTEKPVKI